MICHDYKCVFVHIPKNAGQSIEKAFIDLLGLEWRTRAPLLLRTNREPELGPPKLAHLKANQYVPCKYITEDMFEEYFKFSFSRNPWSRMVSIYNHLGYSRKCSFSDFLKKDFKNKLFDEKHWFVGPQSGFLQDDEGNMLMDYVGKVEELQAGFDSVCDRLSLPSINLSHLNSSIEKEKHSRKKSTAAQLKRKVKSIIPDNWTQQTQVLNSYKDYYDNECIDIIANLYKSDIELFGYDFNE